MAVTTKCISSNSIHKNNGTVVMGGNVSATGPVTNAPAGLVFARHQRASYGSQITTNLDQVAKALSSGTLAKMVAGKYVMMGGNVTTSLAGVDLAAAKTLSGNTGVKHSIHSVEKVWTRRIVTAGWNYVTGKPLTSPTVNEDEYKNLDSGTYTDQAAHPSRAVPGEFVYMFGGKRVQLDNYKAKTGS